MFDYDRLMLDISQLNIQDPPEGNEPSTTSIIDAITKPFLSSGDSWTATPPTYRNWSYSPSSGGTPVLPSRESSSQSSGYCSPSWSPLSSPLVPTNAATQSVAISPRGGTTSALSPGIPAHIQRALSEHGFADDVSSTHLSCSFNDSSSQHEQPNFPPAAVIDGFSAEEIASFEKLLCSPKKLPPGKYQCHICYDNGHYISDCPRRYNSQYDELTPYQGRKKCYGEFQCDMCKRKWTSQNSVANEAQSCIKCHVSVFPHKQLPVEKALSLGYIKQPKHVPVRIAPIGHGRPTASPRHAFH